MKYNGMRVVIMLQFLSFAVFQCTFCAVEPETTKLSKLLSGFRSESEPLIQDVREEAKKEIERRKGKNELFSPIEQWQIRVLGNDLLFSPDAFLNLTLNGQRLIYQTANNLGNVEFTKRLNELKDLNYLDKEKIYSLMIQPSIVSHLMDVSTMYSEIVTFLKKLAHAGKIMQEKDVEQLKGWRKKPNDLTRIIGREYIQNLIDKFSLKYIKVPEKKLILKDGEVWTFNAELSVNRFPHVKVSSPDVVGVYAEEIIPAKRKVFLSRKAIEEFIFFVKTAYYTDMHKKT